MDQDFTKSKVGSNLQGWMWKTRICRWPNRMMEEYQNDVLGYSNQTRRQECGIFQVDLQDKTCFWWKEIFVAIGFSQREGICYEETLSPGSKVHFHQNYHGTCFHDEVGSTPNGCNDNLPERKMFTSNNHKDLKLNTEWLMYVCWKMLCMEWRKLLELGMEELIALDKFGFFQE